MSKYHIQNGGRRFSISVGQRYTNVVLTVDEQSGDIISVVLNPTQASELSDALKQMAGRAYATRQRETDHEPPIAGS